MTDLEKLELARRALERISVGDVPREVTKYWRADCRASKHDQCRHGNSMWQDCSGCTEDFARTTLHQIGEQP